MPNTLAALAPLDPVPPGTGARTRSDTTLDRRGRRRYEVEVARQVGLPAVAGLVATVAGGVDDDGHPWIEGAVALHPVALPMPPERAVAATVAVLAALDGLHRAGLVHGVVHPGAVLADGDGFALAPPVPPVVLERTGPESPAHCAPEVLRGEEPGPAADVYAAAATLVHLASGRPPWPGSDAESVLLALAGGRPADLGPLTADDGVAAAVRASLAPDPAARPAAAALALRLAGGGDDAADRIDTMPPSAPPVAMGGRPLGSRYLVHERIGRGATGEVYRGSTRSGQPVAVKVLHDDLASDPVVVTRFLAERTTVTSIRHPNLVPVHDLVAEGDTLAIVMDLVDGPDLRRWLRTAPPLPPAAACRLLAKLADALAAVHAAGIVHRDLKPENVLLDRVGVDAEPRPRLTDFGIARTGSGAVLTRADQLLGTVEYLAPEVGGGQGAGPAADVYALGVIAYELLAGARPFGGNHPATILRAHAELAPRRPADIDAGLWTVVAACLAKDPAQRPTAGEVAAALGERAGVLEGLPPLARLPAAGGGSAVSGSAPAVPALDTLAGSAPLPPRPPEESDEQADRRRRRRRVGLAVAGILAISAAAGVAFAVATDDEESPPPTTAPPPPGLVAVPVVTSAARVDDETLRLSFEPVDGAIRHVVVRDPQDEPGVQLDTRVLAGAGTVDVLDEANDVHHCYVVVAQLPGSTPTTTAPQVLRPACTDQENP